MKSKTIIILLTLFLSINPCRCCDFYDIPCHVQDGINQGRKLLGDELLGSLGGAVKSTLQPLFDAIPNAVKSVLDPLFNAIPSGVKTILEPLFDVVEQMIDIIPDYIYYGIKGTIVAVNQQDELSVVFCTCVHNGGSEAHCRNHARDVIAASRNGDFGNLGGLGNIYDLIGGFGNPTQSPTLKPSPSPIATAHLSTSSSCKTVGAIPGIGTLAEGIVSQSTTFSNAVTQGFVGTTNQLTGINNEIKSLQTSYGSIPNQISGVTNQVTGITSQIQAVGQSISGVTGAVGAVTNQVTSITNQMGSVTGQIGSLSDTMTQVGNGVTNQVSGITGQIGTLSSSVTQGIGSVTNQVSSVTHQINGVKTQLQSLGSNAGEIMRKTSNIENNLGNVMNDGIPGLDTKLDSILGEGVPLLDDKLDGLLDIIEKLATVAVSEGTLENEVGAFADTLNVCFIQLLDLGDLAQAIESITGFSIDDVPEFAASIPDPTDIVFRVIAKVFLKYKSLLDFFCADGIRIIMELADKWLGGGILPINTGDNTSRRRMSGIPAPAPNCADLEENEFCEPDKSSGIYSYENPANEFYIGLVNGLGSATSSNPLIPDPYDNSDTNEFIKYKKVGFILYLVEEVRERSCNTIMNILGNELLKMAIPGTICEAIGTGIGYANKILEMTLGAVDVHDGDINNVRLKAVFRDRITIIHNQKMLENELEILRERINSEFNFSTTNVNDRFDLHLIKLEKETKDLTNKLDNEFGESNTNINDKFQILTTNINNNHDSLTHDIEQEFIDSTININGKFDTLTGNVNQQFITSNTNINSKFQVLTQKVNNEFGTSTTNINEKLNILTERVNEEFNVSTQVIRDIHDLQMIALQQGFVDLVGSPQGAQYTLTKIKESLDTVENKLENRMDGVIEKMDEEFTSSTSNFDEKVAVLTQKVETEFQTLTTNMNDGLSSLRTAVIDKVFSEFTKSTTNIDDKFDAQISALQAAVIEIRGSTEISDNTLAKIKEVVDTVEDLWRDKYGPKGKSRRMMENNVNNDESGGLIALKIRPFDIYMFVGIGIGFYLLSMALVAVAMTKYVNNGNVSHSNHVYSTTDATC